MKIRLKFVDLTIRTTQAMENTTNRPGLILEKTWLELELN